MAATQRGGEIVIKDRETPIARLVPYQKPAKRLLTRPPTGSLKDLDKLPRFAPKGLTLADLEAAFQEERRERLGNDME